MMQRRAISAAIVRGRYSSTARRRLISVVNRYLISSSSLSSCHSCTAAPLSLWSRSFATTTTTVDNDTQEENEVIIDDDSVDPNNTNTVVNPMTVYTTQQINLLQYTTQILPTNLTKYPPGTLEYIKLLQLSNCITQWIDNSSSIVGAQYGRGLDDGSIDDTTISEEQQQQQRYLGAEQAVKLVKRLIIERGGGRSLLSSTSDNDDDLSSIHRKIRPNPEVTFEMYSLYTLIGHLSTLYEGQEFVNIIMDIIQTFEDEYILDDYRDEDGVDNMMKDDLIYQSIIDILCKLNTYHGVMAAEILLHRFEIRLREEEEDKQKKLEEDHEQSSSSSMMYHNAMHSNPPTTESYNKIMSAYRKLEIDSYIVQSPPTTTSNNTAQSSSSVYIPPPYKHHRNPCSNMLHQISSLYNSNPNTYNRIKPNHISFNQTISSTSKKYGKTCYKHLMEMLNLYHSGEVEECAPDLVTFSTVLNALARDGRDVEERACRVLDEMLSLSEVFGNGTLEEEDRVGKDDKEVVVEEEDQTTRRYGYEFDVVPRNRHFNVVLSLLAKSSGTNKVTFNKAQQYVNIMEELEMQEEEDGRHLIAQSSTHFDHPPTTSINNDNGEENGQSQQQQRQQQKYEQSIFSMTRSAPDTLTYNTLISVAAQAGMPEKAEEILEYMIEKSTEKEHYKPDNISFNTVLSAWAKVRNVKRAEEFLHRMQMMADEGDTDIRPDRTSLTTIIGALISSARRNRSAPGQAERIITLMENNKESSMRPDVVTYTSLLKCWIESGQNRSASRAEEIVNLLHQRYDDGHEECKPDTLLYNVAMNALAKSNEPNTAERSEALLNRMLDCYNAGDTDLTPTTQSFSTAILAWARTNDLKGAQKAEQLLQTMHQLDKSDVRNVAPNTICYTTCILAWKNSKCKDAGRRADDLLKKMEEYEKKGLKHLRPNAISYTNAMEAWIKSRHPRGLKRAVAIMDHMMKRAHYNPESAPTTLSFNVLMKAIQHSSLPLKYERAEELLNQMKSMQELGNGRAKPSIVTYNAFFSACATTEGDSEDKINAFSVVLNALIELQDIEHLHPDTYTWPAVWKACENLLDIERDMTWINRIFELTIKSGHINELLFNNMRRYLPEQYLQSKLKTKTPLNQLTVRDLPTQWTRHAKLGRDQTKRPSNNRSKGRRRKQHSSLN